MNLIGRMLEKRYSEYIYLIFRLGIGGLFFMLGIQKLFGLWGMPGGAPPAWSFIWFAGVFEFMIGLSLVTGVLVRIASFFGVIMMVVAYYIGHVAPNGNWNPAVNMGISALVFALAFLMTFVKGSGKLGLEYKVLGKEIF